MPTRPYRLNYTKQYNLEKGRGNGKERFFAPASIQFSWRHGFMFKKSSKKAFF